MQVKANTTYRRFIPWGISLFFFILCGLLAYRVLDQAVTLDYGQSWIQVHLKQRNALRIIAEPFMKGITKMQLINLLQKNKIEYFANEFDDPNTMDEIVAEEVIFYFEKDKLVRVEVD